MKKITPYALQKKLFEEDDEDSQILSQQQQQQTNSSKLTRHVIAAVYIYNYCHSFVQYYIYQFLNIKQEQSKKKIKYSIKPWKTLTIQTIKTFYIILHWPTLKLLIRNPTCKIKKHWYKNLFEGNNSMSCFVNDSKYQSHWKSKDYLN